MTEARKRAARLLLTGALLTAGGFASFFTLALLAGGGYYQIRLGPPDGIAQMGSGGMRGGEGGDEGRKDMMKTDIPGVRPEQLPDPESEGANLLLQYCAQCHNLPSPMTHSASEWEGVVDRMDRHMAMMKGKGHREMRPVRRPTDDEKNEILAYLQAHALLAFSADQFPVTDSVGARLFSKFCVQCHVMPSPLLHTAAEWPGVVERMRMNMRVLRKPVITDEERDAIVDYLRSVSKE